MTPPQFTLDWPHGWMTRDEQNVETYCTDAPGDWPIHGHIDGRQTPDYWRGDGSYDRTPGCPHNDDLINRPAPTVSVPADKLRDGAMFESLALKRAIIAPEESNLKCGSSRPVKWFYADEMEIEK